jgi:RNA polymerase sigma-70 factor (ECF subfamily)
MNRTDQEWATQLRSVETAQHQPALEELRALLLHGLRHALAANRVTEPDLEDFVQDGLLKILQNLDSFRGESRFTTWAQKICVYVALSELRRRRWRDVSLDEIVANRPIGSGAVETLIGAAPEPGRMVSTQAMLAAIQRIIEEELTDLQRTAMVAVMESGMPLQEVAERMGTNRNALYKLLHDGRRRMKARMIAEGMSPHELLAMFDAV